MKPSDALPHPEDWSVRKVREVVQFRRGLSWSKEQERSEPRDDAIPVLRIGNVQQSLDLSDVIYITGVSESSKQQKKVSQGWSILVASNGNRERIGNTVYQNTDSEFLFASFLLAIKPVDNCDIEPEYFYRWLSSAPVQTRLSATSEGSTGLSNLSQSFFRAMEIAYPEVGEQTKISLTLDAVDNAIARTRDTLAKAEHLKQGVLNELLKRGIGPDGRIRVDDKAAFQCTSLGYLPIAWGVSKVRDEFTLSTGFTLGEHRRPKINRRKYLRVANVQRGSIMLDDLKELEAKDGEMTDRTLTKNDLLVVEGHANPKEIGRCALVPHEAAGLTFQNHLFRLRPKKLTPGFAEIWLNSPWVQGYWQRTCASTSGLHTINQRTLYALPVVVPPLDEQRAIVDTIEALSANICWIEAKMSHLMKLKRGLMQELLTGRTRV
jgi:type I restriction enzyme S subunit